MKSEKVERVKQIADLVVLQEDAIRQHPHKVLDVYIKSRDAFIEGQSSAIIDESSKSISLTPDQMSLVNRYMLSSSFISAWYHLAGNKTNRDKAAHSCCTLVSCLGLNPEAAMTKYIEFEQLWRLTMKNEGVAPKRFYRIGFIAIIIVIILLGVLYSRY